MANEYGHDLIVVGASTGGVEALIRVVSGLPPDLPAAVCAVLHMSPDTPGRLPTILACHSSLRVHQASDGLPLELGNVYVARPDHHLLVEHGCVRVTRGPRENRSRPAVDPLFRSAALSYGLRVVGVVLTGALDDGTSGLRAIKRRGGIAVVQDPADALMPGMLQNALRYVPVDHRVPLARMAPLLVQLAHEPAPDAAAYPVSRKLVAEVASADMECGIVEMMEQPGTLSAMMRPECQGPLWESRDGELIRFRRRSGHAFSVESMLEGQTQAVEEALWAAVNTLNESAALAERLAAMARSRKSRRIAEHYESHARDARRHADVLLNALAEGETAPPNSDDSRDIAGPPESDQQQRREQASNA